MIPCSETDCACEVERHDCKLVALTGGPGAGKTAVLEVVRKHLCQHVAVLPEAAGIVFGGGFPRGSGDVERRAAQCAIYHVQRQLERVSTASNAYAVALCDRGTLDGLAYWPGPESSYFEELQTSKALELARYRAVIHLRTPQADGGYDLSNPLRIESAAQAAEADQRILEAWSEHPRRIVIDSSSTFVEKLLRAVEAIRAELPVCGRRHEVPEVDGTLAHT